MEVSFSKGSQGLRSFCHRVNDPCKSLRCLHIVIFWICVSTAELVNGEVYFRWNTQGII